jgi:hypothetical protein
MEGKMKVHKNFFFTLLVVLLLTLGTLIPALPVSALSGVVTLSQYSGPPSTALYISGTGYTVGSTYYIYFGTNALAYGTVQAGGTVYNYISVPTVPRGSYNITITTGVDTTPLPPAFTITPQIFLSSTSGSSGDQLTINGNGFLASSIISIYFDGVAITPTTTVSSDVNGQLINAIITVPQASGGTHTISASDYGITSTAVTYTIIRKMTLSATTGAVGSSITASGTGFAVNSAMSFSIDGIAISTTATTDASGKFTNVALVMPAIAGGSHTITAQDASGNYSTSTVTVTAAMTISPNTGPVDTNVTLTGKGFLASSPITITYDSANVTTTSSLTSNADGNVSISFKVPTGASGSHVITVSDGTHSISTNFTSLSTATVSPTSGPVGTTITASGSGFRSSGKITITYNNIQAGTATASVNGSFSTTFPIPSSSTGAHSLVITDQTNTQSFPFSITPAANISSTSGYVGSDITINGTGFISNGAITVKYDGEKISSATTDTNGTFAAVFKAPVSKGGSHSLSVSDDTNTKTFTFAMDTTPPAAPALFIPLSLTRAEKMANLQWEDVKDPSGVTYSLQITTDASFSKIVLQKTGLTTPAYQLTQSETLKSASKSKPYYWRVKAIDAASNEGQWSTPFTFYVGFVMPSWALYSIFGVVAIALGVIGFWLGRRSGHKMV